MVIHGLKGLTLDDVHRGVAAGRRFVFYEWCISLIVVSVRRPSKIYFLRADELGLLRAVPFTLVSLFLGWWGLPWGVIYTPLTLVTNLGGGQDVTDEVLAFLRATAPRTNAATSTEDPSCEPSTQFQAADPTSGSSS